MFAWFVIFPCACSSAYSATVTFISIFKPSVVHSNILVTNTCSRLSSLFCCCRGRSCVNSKTNFTSTFATSYVRTVLGSIEFIRNRHRTVYIQLCVFKIGRSANCCITISGRIAYCNDIYITCTIFFADPVFSIIKVCRSIYAECSIVIYRQLRTRKKSHAILLTTSDRSRTGKNMDIHVVDR